MGAVKVLGVNMFTDIEEFTLMSNAEFYISLFTLKSR